MPKVESAAEFTSLAGWKSLKATNGIRTIAFILKQQTSATWAGLVDQDASYWDGDWLLLRRQYDLVEAIDNSFVGQLVNKIVTTGQVELKGRTMTEPPRLYDKNSPGTKIEVEPQNRFPAIVYNFKGPNNDCG